MNRTPPESVRRQLRAEVGFGCPVPGCDNPYLTYHHFEPPWSEREHHEAGGMIALCQHHHAKADAGAFSRDQLRSLKNAPPRPLAGRFDWLRHKLLAVAGGNLYYETPTLVQYRDAPVIWFDRSPDGYLLLNTRMLTETSEARLWLERNDWLLIGTPTAFVCPPSGRSIKATFANGDFLSLEFLELASARAFLDRFPHFRGDHLSRFEFPSTAVEIQMTVGGTSLRLGPEESTFGGAIMRGGVIANCRVGVALS